MRCGISASLNLTAPIKCNVRMQAMLRRGEERGGGGIRFPYDLDRGSGVFSFQVTNDLSSRK